jgi:hypothetical protein
MARGTPHKRTIQHRAICPPESTCVLGHDCKDTRMLAHRSRSLSPGDELVRSRASSVSALELQNSREPSTTKVELAGQSLTEALDKLIATLHSTLPTQRGVLLDSNDTAIAARVWLEYFLDVEHQLGTTHAIEHPESFELLLEILVDAKEQVNDLVQTLSNTRDVSPHATTWLDHVTR